MRDLKGWLGLRAKQSVKSGLKININEIRALLNTLSQQLVLVNGENAADQNNYLAFIVFAHQIWIEQRLHIINISSKYLYFEIY